MQLALLAIMRPRKGLLRYDSGRVSCRDKEHQRDGILDDDSICLVFANDWCARKCCQFILRYKIRFFCHEMCVIQLFWLSVVISILSVNRVGQ